MNPDLDRDPFDPYRELQLAPGAEPDLVKAAFKALARKHHPDRFTDPEDKARAEERMKRLNEAQRLLTEGGYRPPPQAREPNWSSPPPPAAASPTPKAPPPRERGRSTPPASKSKGPIAARINFGIFALLLLGMLVFLLAGPQLSRYHQSKAAALLAEQRLEEALKQADRALQHDDRNAEAYLLRAEIYDGLGEPERAEIDRRNGRGLLPRSNPASEGDPPPTPTPETPPDEEA